MNSIIYTCKYGDIVHGFLGKSIEPLSIVNIYIQNPWDRLGIYKDSNYFSDHIDGVFVESFEVSYFFKLLYEGNLKAWDILFLEGNDVQRSLMEIDLLKRDLSDLISMKVIYSYYGKAKECEDSLKELVEEGEEDSLVYARDLYFGFKRIFESQNLLTNSTARLTQGQTNYLDLVNSNSLSLVKFVNKLTKVIKEVEKSIELSTSIPETASIEQCNQLIMKLRNLDIKELNYE